MNLLRFFQHGLWKIPPDEKRPIRTFFVKAARIIVSSFTSFYNDECVLKASLLTFYSLIAIVPLLAVALAVAKGFGLEEFLQTQVLSTFKEQEGVLAYAMKFAYAYIENINSQLIAGLGVFILFIAVFALLEAIEKSLNDIWRIKKRRGIFRRAINYIALLILCPFVFIVSSSLTIYTTQLLSAEYSYSIVREISSFMLSMMKFLPFFLSWIAFSVVYLFTPNSKISVIPRIFSGVVAGTLFQLWQMGYIALQVTLTSYNAIYGSFAALPLFLIWLQVNYFIFLYGAELSAHIENDRYYKFWKSEDRLREVSPKYLAILILHQCAHQFNLGNPPLSAEQIAKNVGIPTFIALDTLHILEKAKILAEVHIQGEWIPSFQLLINPELLTIKRISDVMEKREEYFVTVRASKTLELIDTCFKEFDRVLDGSKSNLNLKDISTLTKES